MPNKKLPTEAQFDVLQIYLNAQIELQREQNRILRNIESSNDKIVYFLQRLELSIYIKAQEGLGE